MSDASMVNVLKLMLVGVAAIVFSDSLCYDTLSTAMRWTGSGATSSTPGTSLGLMSSNCLGGLMLQGALAYAKSVLVPRLRAVFSGKLPDAPFNQGLVPGSCPPEGLPEMVAATLLS